MLVDRAIEEREFWRGFWDTKVKSSKNVLEAAGRGARPDIEFFWAMNYNASLLNLKKTDVVLDAGCGIGITELLYSPFVKEIYGFDISREAIRVATYNIGDLPNVKVAAGTFDNIRCPDGFFDKVIACGLFQYLVTMTEVEKSLRVIYRVLKQGGGALIGNNPDKEKWEEFVAAVCDWTDNPAECRDNEREFHNNHVCWFDRKEFVDLAEQIGFKPLIVEIPKMIFQSVYMFDLLLVKP